MLGLGSMEVPCPGGGGVGLMRKAYLEVVPSGLVHLKKNKP
jgi:hypothetical protein